ncbi:hypothetical protein [Arthrobacter bambusae]|uniref:hypothetical protein n=2 Tax=Arthrobacter bambusae TaxID=1338426 RepID=UPI002784DFCC|nr:hypothetical protein [Arthrobacter bambusae]MDQ0210550.1 hypothetical protein [Arthrobacter bambusae]MDQ0235222.1 hypothetical protein [Arthrobacter bambusae]
MTDRLLTGQQIQARENVRMGTGIRRRISRCTRLIKGTSLIALALIGLTACGAGPVVPTNDVSAIKEDLMKLQGTNGLIMRPESSTLAKGSVHGTYLAARLLDTSFPAVVSERTRDELERVLKTPETDQITQLKALVALKRSGSPSWGNYGSIIEQGRAALPATVTFAKLSGYIELVDVLVQLEPNARLARLEAFDADPGVEDLLSGALMALSNSMYFSNSEEVRSMFPAVQSALPQLIDSSKGKGLNYFRALAAMTSASRSGLGSNDFDKAAEELRTLKGCKEFPSLYRMEADKASPCSLSISAAMIAVPGAYDFGENK